MAAGTSIFGHPADHRELPFSVPIALVTEIKLECILVKPVRQARPTDEGGLPLLSDALTGVWLTRDAVDRWAIAIAFAVAASGAADKALSPWAAQTPHDPSADQGGGRPAASTTPPGTDPPSSRDTDPDGAQPDPSTPPPDPASPPPEPPGGRRWPTRDRVTTALVSAAVTAAVCAVVYGALAPETGHARAASTTTASGTRSSGAGTTAPHDCTLVYCHRTPALKNYTFHGDLRGGAVSVRRTGQGRRDRRPVCRRGH